MPSNDAQQQHKLFLSTGRIPYKIRMGKKSRRPNRNKSKDIPAAASTAVADPRQVISSPADDVATFKQMLDSQDWAGILELESKISAIANTRENDNPKYAGCINFNLGHAHFKLGREGGREGGFEQATLYYGKAVELAKKAGDNSTLTKGMGCLTECYLMTGTALKKMGREGGIEQASLYFKKAVELAKKAGNNVLLTLGVGCLSACYVEMSRVDEAMDLYKSLCDEIGKESLDANAILEFAEILRVNYETSRALTILENHLEVIDRSWGKQEQCRAYGMMAEIYCTKNDFTKSNVYFERQLSIAKDTKNVELEAEALHGLGHNYGCMGDHDNAMAYLEQALLIESERGDHKIGMTYCFMGEVLVAQEGREKEAILMLQKCVGLFEEGNQSKTLMGVFIKLGQAYKQIKAWDEAIASLEKSISISDSIEDERRCNQLKVAAMRCMGNTYLEKYESLPERNDEVIRKALFWSEAAFEGREIENLALFLDMAQEHYFLGDTEKAHLMLKEYLDGSLELGAAQCQTCGQICEKDAHMEKCSVCKVARYCSQAHSIQAWKKGRLCHKVLCPLLKRWRKLTEGQDATTELSDKLFSNFFERVLGSKPK